MKSRFLLFSSVFTLGACAYVIDNPTQDLTVLTPGAYNAACDAYIGNVRYRFNPPETINVIKSKDDLVIDCKAPGNRRSKVVIEAAIDRAFYANALNGAGAAWDYLSEAMFVYPSKIEVNFEDMPVKEEALPAQNRPDIKQPEAYDLEEYTPSMPRLNDDKYAIQPELQRRQRSDAGRVTIDSVSTSDAPDSKAVLTPVLGPMNEDLNPAGPPTPGTDAPIPLYPGQ